MNLLDLNYGETGVIKKITAERDLKQRLLTMGFTQGSNVRLEKKAPLGDPIDFLIKDYHVSLRKNEARFIEIEKSEQ